MASLIYDRQNHLFGVISRTVANLKKLGKDNITKGTVQSRIPNLDQSWEKFERNHEELLRHISEKTASNKDVYFSDDLFSKCEDQYLQAKSELLDLLNDFELGEQVSRSSDYNSTTISSITNTRSKCLPKITLPKFSGRYSEWIPFRDLFQSMVRNNNEISAVEKLHYLKTNLTGEAIKLIANVPITDDNYERAWQRLTSRYENKRALVNAHLDTFFAIKPLTKKCSKDLDLLRSTVAEILEALEALGAPVGSWDFFVVYFVCRRLDPETHEAWEITLTGQTEPPTYAELNTFLEGRVRALETVDGRNATGRPKPSTTQVPRALSATAQARTPSNSQPCPLCGSNHYIASCPSYKIKSPEQRRDFVTNKKLCFNCLGAHRVTQCRSQKRCLVCGQQHHTTIHVRASGLPASSSGRNNHTLSPSSPAFIPNAAEHAEAAPSQPSSPVHHAVPMSPTRSPSQVLLATAVVTVASPQGSEIFARALIDQGSELSFVTESLVQALLLPRRRASISLVGIGANKQVTTRGAVSLCFRNRQDSSVEYTIEAFVLSKLTGRIPSSTVHLSDSSHLDGLDFADPSFTTPGFVDILLGANVYGHLLEEDIRRGDSTAPVAQRTSLGWIVSGPVLSADSNPCPSSFFCRLDSDLHELVHDFWRQEEVVSPSADTPTDDALFCESHFVETHSRDSDGRYMVRLPFKSTPVSFGNSRPIALRMLGNLHRRFRREPSLRQPYADFLSEYLALNHMKEVEDKGEPDAFYLPHHGVLRETSSTTRLRVVFNGSQRVDVGVSLNDVLHSGPRLQQDLVNVLLRWRRYPYAFSSDIEKMYRQILVHPADRRYQRILWSEDSSQGPQTFELSTVTYGLTCAPYLAIRVLHQLASDHSAQFPLAAATIRENFYVDDVLSGDYSIDLAQAKVKQVDNLLMAGGFPLQKWASNFQDVLSPIEESRRQNVEKAFEDDRILRALGLNWDPNSDCFVFTFNRDVANSAIITKRSVLSFVARMFDPLGWLAPILVTAKIFLQQLWKSDLGWDEELPPRLALRWEDFTRRLFSSQRIPVSRWIGTHHNSLVEVHGFSDASQSAMAAAVYLRVQDDSSGVRTSLLIAKTKVAPLKAMTIPRLELTAAVLLAKLVASVEACLDLADAPLHLWVDSSVALAWIGAHPSRWKDFVSNRVSLIQELVPRACWHHISGTENPSDVASRGLSPDQLKEHPLWWTGPDWLRLPQTSWPNYIPPPLEDVNMEERPSIVLTVNVSPQVWDLVDRFSSLNLLLRVTARIMQATKLMRRKVRREDSSATITPEQLNDALNFWVRSTQAVFFEQELRLVRNGSSLPRSSSLYKLTPTLDSEGLLRVGGRLRHSGLDYDCKHPIILPRHSSLGTLLVDDAHRRTLHGGVQLTLAHLRQRVWILGGRATVRSFILKCVPCTRQRGSLLGQQMGQLPSTRIAPSRPFFNSGVDYAGPYTLKTWKGRSAKTYKAYFIVFVCFSTSAVHLELVTDYSTEGFITAYRRFTSRRGICSTLTSDCGSNLVGADAELKRLFSATSAEFAHLRSLLANDHTEWRFNPPAAPHFGGKWEASVKSVKFHLRRVVGEALLTYEEFSSVLTQVEGILNSRPLCPLTDDPDDFSALTPGHFLTGAAISTLPEPSTDHISVSRLSRWQLHRQMVSHFWRRWSRECLQRMQIGSKWLQPHHNVRVGSLVLIADQRYPPSKWPLARITAVHPGADGHVRVVTVRTAVGSEFRRPVVKLCLLPVNPDESAKPILPN